MPTFPLDYATHIKGGVERAVLLFSLFPTRMSRLSMERYHGITVCTRKSARNYCPRIIRNVCVLVQKLGAESSTSTSGEKTSGSPLEAGREVVGQEEGEDAESGQPTIYTDLV